MTVYDNRFNGNEWFVLILLSTYIIVFLFPRRFSIYKTLLFILFGAAMAIFMDHSISLNPIDFYDVNDNSNYNLFDFLLYMGYGPFSYFMVYLFDKFRLKKHHALFYIPACSAAAFGFERLAQSLGVFHFKNGYKAHYSFPIYLLVFSILFTLYFRLCRKEE